MGCANGGHAIGNGHLRSGIGIMHGLRLLHGALCAAYHVGGALRMLCARAVGCAPIDYAHFHLLTLSKLRKRGHIDAHSGLLLLGGVHRSMAVLGAGRLVRLYARTAHGARGNRQHKRNGQSFQRRD